LRLGINAIAADPITNAKNVIVNATGNTNSTLKIHNTRNTLNTIHMARTSRVDASGRSSLPVQMPFADAHAGQQKSVSPPTQPLEARLSVEVDRPLQSPRFIAPSADSLSETVPFRTASALRAVPIPYRSAPFLPYP
jgi:hypothetical protein